MDQVGDIDRDIAVALNQDFLSVRRYRVSVENLSFQFQTNRWIVVKKNQVKRAVFGSAAPGGGIELIIDQFCNGRYAVARHLSHFASGCRDQLAADNEQAMLIAQDEAFNDN